MYGGKSNDPKRLRDSKVTLNKKYLEVYGACQQKTTLRQFFLSTNDNIMRLKG